MIPIEEEGLVTHPLDVKYNIRRLIQKDTEREINWDPQRCGKGN
jgi:hypothetical protein